MQTLSMQFRRSFISGWYDFQNVISIFLQVVKNDACVVSEETQYLTGSQLQ